MALVEGSSMRLAYKAYASGTITANTKATSSSDLGASSAQTLRRVSSSLALGMDRYQSEEIRYDQQIVDERGGTERVTGDINGEFSPATYKDFFEAALRGTWASAVSKSNTELTSAAADNTTSTFTFGGGNPVTEGFRVGMIVRFGTLSDTDNNSKNFLITGFSGSNLRDMAVYPAPDTMSADTSFTIAGAGKYLLTPSSSFVKRKFGFEHYYEDSDFYQLFTECRIGNFNVNLPANGISTVTFGVMGRDMETDSGGSAPFFTSPTAETTTGLFQAVNGLLRVNGVNQGVVTGVTLNFNRNINSNAVVGQKFVPEIHNGRAVVTGQMTAFLEDSTLISLFRNETEVGIIIYLKTTSAVDSPAVSIFLPRVKFTSAPPPATGEGPQIVTLDFVALKYTTAEATAGISQTTLMICDTEVS